MKKWTFIVVAILIILILIRIMLPHWVLRYTNRTLNNLEHYRGSIADVDLAIYRGALRIHDLKIFKIRGNAEVPFINIPAADFGLEWPALLRGAVVGRIILYEPALNFIAGAQEQLGEEVDWVEKARELLPVRLERLEIREGVVAFRNFSTEPNVDIRLELLNLTATNLTNVENRNVELPSSVKATATSIGGGILEFNMDMNILKPVPDLDMNLKLEKVHMPALNDFFKAYANVDVEKGIFNLYSEIVVADGKLDGYLKPVAEQVDVVDLEKDIKNPLSLVWESFVGFLAALFKNQSEEQVASKIPLSGDLNNIDVSVWAAIGSILKNAFGEAFSKSTDDAVEFNGEEAEIKKAVKSKETEK